MKPHGEPSLYIGASSVSSSDLLSAVAARWSTSRFSLALLCLSLGDSWAAFTLRQSFVWCLHSETWNSSILPKNLSEYPTLGGILERFMAVVWERNYFVSNLDFIKHILELHCHIYVCVSYIYVCVWRWAEFLLGRDGTSQFCEVFGFLNQIMKLWLYHNKCVILRLKAKLFLQWIAPLVTKAFVIPSTTRKRSNSNLPSILNLWLIFRIKRYQYASLLQKEYLEVGSGSLTGWPIQSQRSVDPIAASD